MSVAHRFAWWALAAGAALGLLAGCAPAASSRGAPYRASRVPLPARSRGIFPGLRYTYRGVARLRYASPPASAALAGANDLLATGPAAILAATNTGIYRSADGGRTWARVFTGPRLWGWSALDAMPGGGYAALGERLGRGMRVQDGGVTAGTAPPAPVIAFSADGIHWRLRTARSPFAYGGPVLLQDQIALSGSGPHAIGFAVPDPIQTFFGSPPLRTTDGGRTWARLAAPQDATGLSLLPGGRTVYVTATGPAALGSSCYGAVYQSTDAGATWHLLASSCEPYPLMAVQFTDARRGFAAGGQNVKFGGGQVFEATVDGGRTWQTRWRTRPENGPVSDNGIVRIAMTGLRNGFVLTGGCTDGENGPCGGTVYATTDGGFRWLHTTQGAAMPGALSVAVLGSGRAIAAGPAGAGTAITSDAGLTWTAEDPAAWVGTGAYSASGSTALWSNSLGTYLTTDAGRHWAPVTLPAARGWRYATWLATAPDDLLGIEPNDQDYATLTSADGGLHWTRALIARRVSPADTLVGFALGTGPDAVALVGPGSECLSAAQVTKIQQSKPGWSPPSGASLLFTSADGGAHWRKASADLPFGVSDAVDVAVSGPRIAVTDSCYRLELSPDSGRHWRAEALGHGQFCLISEFGREIWLTCGSWLLHSTDGGARWMLYRLPAAAAARHSAALGGVAYPFTGVYATGPDSAVTPDGGSLLLTTDGGRTWTQRWPPLPGD